MFRWGSGGYIFPLNRIQLDIDLQVISKQFCEWTNYHESLLESRAFVFHNRVPNLCIKYFKKLFKLFLRVMQVVKHVPAIQHEMINNMKSSFSRNSLRHFRCRVMRKLNFRTRKFIKNSMKWSIKTISMKFLLLPTVRCNIFRSDKNELSISSTPSWTVFSFWAAWCNKESYRFCRCRHKLQ